ncbi:hypothetical protein SAMN04489740_4364 [Arthrobacter alpinus]|uniref:Uncharacterized protein n=1 Tax=Arthrobacter alpinus TaxID=656366 RepID=A0A1H5PHK4_9MICC|nr:helix-turn-helix domain-containing protein [Arthrobacter alpinus]SEF13353.1 hypothetical protein SAMN04489740_4364 [Arthrobacter alpinus]
MGQRREFKEITNDQAVIAWQSIRQADAARALVLKDVVHLLTTRGLSVRKIAAELGESRSQVNRIIKAGPKPVLLSDDPRADETLMFADVAWKAVGGRPIGTPWAVKTERLSAALADKFPGETLSTQFYARNNTVFVILEDGTGLRYSWESELLSQHQPQTGTEVVPEDRYKLTFE